MMDLKLRGGKRLDPDTFAPEKWAWLVEVAILLGVIFIVSLALRKIFLIIRKKTAKTEKIWQKKIHKIVHLPIQVALWVFGIAFAIDIVLTHYGIDAISAKYVRPLKGASIAAGITWIFLRWVKEVFQSLARKSQKLGVEPGTVYALSKLSSFVISILGLLIIFSIFGFNIVPLLTFGGIGVAGVAIAAQDMIANFFGGAMLHFTRTFSIGDYVVIPSKENFQGYVKEIGWYISVFEDTDRRPVYFPNALFSKAHVINETRRIHRRVKGTVSLRYDDLPKIQTIVDELRDRIASHPEVDETQSFSIQFSDYGTYGIDIYYYFLTTAVNLIRYLAFKQEILLMINEVVEKHGAEFCYPTQNILLTQVEKK